MSRRALLVLIGLLLTVGCELDLPNSLRPSVWGPALPGGARDAGVLIDGGAFVDGGEDRDAGRQRDAGDDDAGSDEDAGGGDAGDSGVPDAGPMVDAGLPATTAHFSFDDRIAYGDNDPASSPGILASVRPSSVAGYSGCAVELDDKGSSLRAVDPPWLTGTIGTITLQANALDIVATDRVLLHIGDASGSHSLRVFVRDTTVHLEVVDAGAPSSVALPFPVTAGWRHLAVTHTGGSTTLWVNGTASVPLSSTLWFSALRASSGAFFALGGTNAGDFIFTGLLDEVHVYPTVLSAADIVIDGDFRPNNSSCMTAAQTLAAHWTFDEQDPGRDVVGDLHLTPESGETTRVPGRSHCALQIAGPAGFLHRKEVASSVTDLRYGTLTAWIHSTTADSNWYPIIATTGPGACDSQFSFAISNGELNAWGSDNSDGGSCINASVWSHTEPLTPAPWVHVAYVSDPGIGHAVYINGQPQALTTGPNAPVGAAQELFLGDPRNGLGEVDLAIGATPWVDSEYFVGEIDDVRVYRAPLSAPEIAALMNELPVNGCGSSGEVDPTWAPLNLATIAPSPAGTMPGAPARLSLDNGGAWVLLANTENDSSLLYRMNLASRTLDTSWNTTGYALLDEAGPPVDLVVGAGERWVLTRPQAGVTRVYRVDDDGLDTSWATNGFAEITSTATSAAVALAQTENGELYAIVDDVANGASGSLFHIARSTGAITTVAIPGKVDETTNYPVRHATALAPVGNALVVVGTVTGLGDNLPRAAVWRFMSGALLLAHVQQSPVLVPRAVVRLPSASYAVVGGDLSTTNQDAWFAGVDVGGGWGLLTRTTLVIGPPLEATRASVGNGHLYLSGYIAGAIDRPFVARATPPGVDLTWTPGLVLKPDAVSQQIVDIAASDDGYIYLLGTGPSGTRIVRVID